MTVGIIAAGTIFYVGSGVSLSSHNSNSVNVTYVFLIMTGIIIFHLITCGICIYIAYKFKKSTVKVDDLAQRIEL